jgi:hypothetical protein
MILSQYQCYLTYLLSLLLLLLLLLVVVVVVVVVLVVVVIVVVVVVVSQLHFLASICWDNFSYPRLLWDWLSQGKELNPNSYSRGTFPRNFRTIWHICNSTAFCPALEMFLVKPMISRYFRQFPVAITSAVMTKEYTDTLLSYQTSLISRAKFSDFVIFSRSRELLYLLQVLFCSLSVY